MAELTLEESIQQILPTLPLPIQKFFEQRKLGATAQFLMERYALHIDQGTVLERELMFLLLGLESPDEFAAELYAQLPISEQVVQDILADINKEVFIPLQEEMKKAIGNIPQSAKPVMPPSREESKTSMSPTPANPQLPPRPPVAFSGGGPRILPPSAQGFGRVQQINASMPNYSPPQPLKYFHLENKIPPREVSQTSLKPVVDEKLLEDREEPHIEFNKSPARTAPPPSNLPGVFIPPEVPMVQPLPATPKIETPPAPLKPTVSPLAPVSSRPYSSDPYREPIDENKSV